MQQTKCPVPHCGEITCPHFRFCEGHLLEYFSHNEDTSLQIGLLISNIEEQIYYLRKGLSNGK